MKDYLIYKKVVPIFFLSLFLIVFIFSGCSLVTGFLSKSSTGIEDATEEVKGSAKTDDNQSNSDQNIIPVAIMDIYQQNTDGHSLEVGNPVYFTAANSFDGDGDLLSYRWEISGIEDISGQSFEFTFNETGTYEITLFVSDSIAETSLKKKIEVTEVDNSIIITGEHSLKVEIQYTFTNNGPGDIEDLFCFMEVPRTYLPYQRVLDRRSNYGKGGQLIQDEVNVVAQFNLGKLTQGKKKTAYINCDAVIYEFEFAYLGDENSYRFGDNDVSIYTRDEYFIDSDSNIIRAAARTAVGEEENPRLAAKKLYDLVVSVLEYDYSSLENGKQGFNHASNILQEGKGVCTDYSVLYTALCRASGIPAQVIQGIPVFSILNETGRELSYGHAWVEIKLPGYGWIPIDVTSEEEFMGYNYFMNLQTYKGSGIFYESLKVDGKKHYPNGVYYTWKGAMEPSVTQEISYRIKELRAEDLGLYKESSFLDEIGYILSEYNAAINHVNMAHGEGWIFDDSAEIAIEETLLERLKELSASLEDVQKTSGFSQSKDDLVRTSKEMISSKQNQINCMRVSDFECNTSYYNIFSNAVEELFEYYNSMIDNYNEKY